VQKGITCAGTKTAVFFPLELFFPSWEDITLKRNCYQHHQHIYTPIHHHLHTTSPLNCLKDVHFKVISYTLLMLYGYIANIFEA